MPSSPLPDARPPRDWHGRFEAHERAEAEAPNLMALTAEGEAIPSVNMDSLPSCPTCYGVGSLYTDDDRGKTLQGTCPVCEGSGRLFGEHAWARQHAMDARCTVVCPACSGPSKPAGVCTLCEGFGTITDYSLAIDKAS